MRSKIVSNVCALAALSVLVGISSGSVRGHPQSPTLNSQSSSVRPELALQTGHSGPVSSVAFAPDGKTIASASADTTVKLWDAQTGELKRTLTGHISSSVAFAPDGKTIASASLDNTVKLWDAQTGELKRTLTGHIISSVAFAPDGKTIASASHDRTVKLWDAHTGELKRTLTGHSSLLISVAFASDGKTIASVSDDNTVKLWDAGSGRLLVSLFRLPPSSPAKPIPAAKPITVDAKEPAPSDADLLFTPEGYYSGSAGADRHVRFLLSDTLYPAESFHAVYHRPDLVKQAIAGKPLPPVGAFKGPYPPIAGFVFPKSGEKITGDTVQVTVEATDDSEVTHVDYFVNGARADAKPITVAPMNESKITVLDLISYVSRRTKALTHDAQHPFLPLLVDFDPDAVIAAKG